METSLPDIYANLPFGLQITIAVLIALSVVGLSVPTLITLPWRLWRMFKKLWPHREGWSGDCNRNPPTCDDPQKAFTGGKAKRWSQMRKQQINDFFMLHIQKPRIISRIKLSTEDVRYPEKYSLAIKESDDKSWETLGEYGQLDVALKPYRKIIAIKWTITKPRVEKWADRPDTFPAWSIYDIELTEVRLFGKWWHVPIKEKVEETK